MTRTDGFTPFLAQMPEPDALCRFWNEYDNRQWTGYAQDLHPEFNVACLWWKLTGLERQKRSASSA